MNQILPITLAFTALLTAGTAVHAQAPKPTATNAAPTTLTVPRSVFTQPATPLAGRDPFFPESTRPYESGIVAARSLAPATVTVKGYSVVGGRPVVIINNRSFMAGDESDVQSNGARAHVRCLEIRPGMVIVEVNGARQQLNF